MQSARTPQEKEFRKREIASTDQAIDALVYKLYGLREEIKIVEGNVLQLQHKLIRSNNDQDNRHYRASGCPA
jgi:hypothetical protein